MSSILQLYTGGKEALSKEAAEKIIAIIQQKEDALLCIAGGHTPLATITYLLQAHQQQRIDLNKIYLVQLDEWVGLDKNNAGSCIAYLQRYLLDYIDLPKDHFHHFHAASTNLEGECLASKKFIESRGGIDCIVLGVGVNGHLGFNEPGTKENDSIRVVSLDAVTTKVGEKYFLENETVVNQGITLGIQEILASKNVIVQAYGQTKSKAIKKILENKVDEQWPITYILQHHHKYLFIDSETLK